MALIVFMAGDVRTCSRHCVFMNHAGNGDFKGKPFQIETEFQMFKLQEDWCSRILAERSNRPADYWTHSAQFKDMYYDRHSAFEVGILTEKSE
jgi:ATP-dependent protease ClpP protease subunit